METIKHTKQLLIGISFLATLLVGSGCTSEEVIGGVGSNAAHPVVQTIRATKSDFNNTKQTDVPLTRTATDGYKTTFKAGDKIGLFAIRNGVIVDNIDNMELTYTVADDGITRWSLPTESNIYYYEGVTYIAYSPHKEGITINPSQTTNDIVSSLVNNEHLQPATDQSTEADYAASDLMIATANADATVIEKVTLTLDFEHKFSLLILVPQVGRNLVPNISSDEKAGFTYRENAKLYFLDESATDVKLNNKVTPLQMPDGCYRAIMKPETLKELSVQYTVEENKQISYSGEISIISGQYYTLTVKSPIPNATPVERSLQPGDFVFHGESGIEIYPGDGKLTDGKIPDYNQAVGIVVTCAPSRMTDQKCNEAGWNHAYVIGLNKSSAYSPNKIHTWCHNTEIDLPYLVNCTTENGADNMNGYLETDTIINNKFAGYGLSLANFGAHSLSLNTYIRPNNRIPENLSKLRSDWFIPSVGQYYDLLKNLCVGDIDSDFDITISSWKAKSTEKSKIMFTNLQKHYAKVGKSINGRCWCSSEYDAVNVWLINFSESNIELNIGNKSANTEPIYAFFAF